MSGSRSPAMMMQSEGAPYSQVSGVFEGARHTGMIVIFYTDSDYCDSPIIKVLMVCRV